SPIWTTGILVRVAMIAGISLRCSGSRCTTTTKAAPVSLGSAAKKLCRAWMPPAEAPIATITGVRAEPDSPPLCSIADGGCSLLSLPFLTPFPPPTAGNAPHREKPAGCHAPPHPVHKNLAARRLFTAEPDGTGAGETALWPWNPPAGRIVLPL